MSELVLIARANNELYHPDCPSRKDMLTSCGTTGSGCHFLQGLPLWQLSGQGDASPGAACIWNLQGGAIKTLPFSLMWESSTSNAHPRAPYQVRLRFYWSASEFSSLFYPVLSFPPFFHRY